MKVFLSDRLSRIISIVGIGLIFTLSSHPVQSQTLLNIPSRPATPAIRIDSELLRQAESAYNIGDAQTSLLLYTRLLEQDPNNYTFQVRQAVALLNATPEFVEQATRAFIRASELDPRNPEPLNFLGRISAAFNRKEEAIAYYQKALQLNSNDPPTILEIQRLQSLSALPLLPESLSQIRNRPLEEYVAAVSSSTEVSGLQDQLRIARSLGFRRFLPIANLGYSRSNFDKMLHSIPVRHYSLPFLAILSFSSQLLAAILTAIASTCNGI